MTRHAEIYHNKKEWKAAREECRKRANGLCERCKKKGIIKSGTTAHHKVWLTDDNKCDWNIAYNQDNLEWICRECHEEEHGRRIDTGLNEFLEPVKNKE
jgi:5-methylcytosine-specific restriction endonuclease McrA